jgi:hypothetical protein
MRVSCEDVRSLLSSYIDGELSEEQAAPTRAHLLDCQTCRESVQEVKVIKRWFNLSVDEGARMAPAGFASRVARRAFAGDPGVPGVIVPTPSSTGVPAGIDSTPLGRAGVILPFVLKMTAIAASLLFVLSLFIRDASLPTGDGIGAEGRPFWEVEEELSGVPTESAGPTHDEEASEPADPKNTEDDEVDR